MIIKIYSKLMQQLFEAYFTKDLSLQCDEQNNIERLCINPECQQYSLHCQDCNCQCRTKHQMCYSILLFIINKKIHSIINNQKEYLIKMFSIQDRLIEQLKQSRKQLIEKIILGDLQERFKDIIADVFYRGNTKAFNGKQANQLFVRLKESSIDQIWNLQSQEFAAYESKSRVIINQLTKLKKSVLYKEGKESNNIQHQPSISLSPHTSLLLDSKIIPIDAPSALQDIKFIYAQLAHPKSIQLLFRASEHQFRAQAFHNKCDNIENTFCLIRTQYDKTIGAYSPLKWNKDENNWAIDQSASSFLLSLQLRQKMALVKPEAAIYNNHLFGPTFGGGFDLFISDKCNQNNLSSCKFPNSYDSKTGQSLNQDKRKILCGGTYFKVVQYEVFMVIPSGDTHY